ncbi:MAG: HD domain-containing protein, partial [Betaproteobacteria bacterium]
MRNGGEATPVVARALQLLQALGVDEATETATRLSADFDGSPKSAEACRKQWGSEVATLLVALHRMAGLGHRVSADGAEDAPGQIETLRRMLLALADDIRVVVIQLALHIATLESVASQMKAQDAAAIERGRRLGQETLKVQAPLANRLGIWQLKWAMEDLAFRMTKPQAYRAIAQRLDETRQEREAFVSTTIARLRDFLSQAGIVGEVAGRPKHLYSIHRKMQAKGLDFDGLMDIRAFRILVDTEAQCYAVLGFLHDHWQPLDSEFDDYITRPKANGYQSLHTVLLDAQGRPFEVQIRTHEMHQRA